MNSQPTLHPALFKFLDAIREENSRKYFASIRPLYDDIWINIQEFIDAVIHRLAQDDISLSDLQAKQCLFRIYRDARRLKDGDFIYKNNRGAHIASGGKKSTKAGYYIHMQSGGSVFGGGIYRPTSEQLFQIREFLTTYGEIYYTIVDSKRFKSRFGNVQGGSLSRMPKGFDLNGAYPELVMKKQHLVYHHYTDTEILSEEFFDIFVEDCLTAKPLFDLLNTPLS